MTLISKSRPNWLAHLLPSYSHWDLLLDEGLYLEDYLLAKTIFWSIAKVVSFTHLPQWSSTRDKRYRRVYIHGSWKRHGTAATQCCHRHRSSGQDKNGNDIIRKEKNRNKPCPSWNPHCWMLKAWKFNQAFFNRCISINFFCNQIS